MVDTVVSSFSSEDSLVCFQDSGESYIICCSGPVLSFFSKLAIFSPSCSSDASWAHRTKPTLLASNWWFFKISSLQTESYNAVRVNTRSQASLDPEDTTTSGLPTRIFFVWYFFPLVNSFCTCHLIWIYHTSNNFSSRSFYPVPPNHEDNWN